MTQPCLYCHAPALVGPCERDDDACNHRVTCEACGKYSVLSANVKLGACPYAVRDVELPLFAEQSA